jgi:hypothetical protein
MREKTQEHDAVVIAKSVIRCSMARAGQIWPPATKTLLNFHVTLAVSPCHDNHITQGSLQHRTSRSVCRRDKRLDSIHVVRSSIEHGLTVCDVPISILV